MRPGRIVSSSQAAIGRLGGRKSSPAKRAAAKAAACKRWGRTVLPVLDVSDLRDGVWYLGKGRNADRGIWDSRSRCFWVTCFVDAVDPLKYPEPGARTVRLKRERHLAEGGTFQPRKPLN